MSAVAEVGENQVNRGLGVSASCNETTIPDCKQADNGSSTRSDLSLRAYYLNALATTHLSQNQQVPTVLAVEKQDADILEKDVCPACGGLSLQPLTMTVTNGYICRAAMLAQGRAALRRTLSLWLSVTMITG